MALLQFFKTDEKEICAKVSIPNEHIIFWYQFSSMAHHMMGQVIQETTSSLALLEFRLFEELNNVIATSLDRGIELIVTYVDVLIIEEHLQAFYELSDEQKDQEYMRICQDYLDMLQFELNTREHEFKPHVEYLYNLDQQITH
ncbi:hypothetical protein LCL95_10525 [Bacillus timonensis]|nr:hypothetical protein [Bacillus timonensis]